MNSTITIEYNDVLGERHSFSTSSELVAQHYVQTAIHHARAHKIPVWKLKFRILTQFKNYMCCSVPFEPYGDIRNFHLHNN